MERNGERERKREHMVGVLSYCECVTENRKYIESQVLP